MSSHLIRTLPRLTRPTAPLISTRTVKSGKTPLAIRLFWKRSLAQSHNTYARRRATGQKSTFTFPRQSGYSFTSILVLGGGIVVATLYFSSLQLAAKIRELDPGSDTLPESIPDQGMVLTALPGRVGNLTADQDAKLQDLWRALFKVLGVKVLNGSMASLTIEEEEDGTSTPDKKKKRRFFRRTNDKDKNGSVASADDDKYGQGKDFEHALADTSPEELRQAFWSMVQADHPDSLLLRFLRARKWDVEKALVMLVATMHWNLKDAHVRDLVAKGEGGYLEDTKVGNAAAKKEGEDFLRQFRRGMGFVHGTDKDGRPLCIVRVRLHKQGEQSESSMENFTIHMLETGRLMIAPPVDTTTIIFDMTGFSLANMDYAPVKFMIKCFEANYPESLGFVLVHRAPWVFQGIWKIIRGWLDPVVAGKVHFTNDVDDLTEWIPKSQIPKELDGDEDWTYEYIEPRAGENSTMQDTAGKEKALAAREEVQNEFQSLTQEWLQASSTDDSPIRKRRDVQAVKFREAYWKLDSYIRAKTLYDRQGVINPGGKIEFYPNKSTAAPIEEKAPPVSTATSGPPATVHSADDVD